MSRPKKNAGIRRSMCNRFVTAMADLQLSPAEMARALGYSNGSTITKIQRGETFVDVERLQLFAKLRTPSGTGIDLHWLITGNGTSSETGT